MTKHFPILVDRITSALTEPLDLWISDPAKIHPLVLLDCTFGGGGHTAKLLEATAPYSEHVKILAMDQDQSAIAHGKLRFKEELEQGRLELLHCKISECGPHIEEKTIVGVLADLGFSSDQLDDPTRGLSFQTEGPLDMRMDPTRGWPVSLLLQTQSEREIADLLWKFGEERLARKIASKLVYLRGLGSLPKTTTELAEVIIRCTPPQLRHRKPHPATRSFQALRIAVNDELGELESLLTHVILKVKSGGRVAIVSFHSLEDRAVKNCFKDRECWMSLTKKPVEADEQELNQNPRSRSAKLRLAERK